MSNPDAAPREEFSPLPRRTLIIRSFEHKGIVTEDLVVYPLEKDSGEEWLGADPINYLYYMRSIVSTTYPINHEEQRKVVLDNGTYSDLERSWDSPFTRRVATDKDLDRIIASFINTSNYAGIRALQELGTSENDDLNEGGKALVNDAFDRAFHTTRIPLYDEVI